MRGKRVSSHNWNPAACSAKANFDNVVIIEVDCDSSENVVVLDVPDSIKQILLGSRRRKGERIIPFHDVISIEDDDEDANLPGPSGTAAGRDGLDSDPISPRRNYMDFDADTDDCCVVPDQHSTSESLEFNNHPSSEHFIGRRFGLSPDLEEDTSENELSDCEVMGDSSRDIRRQWEEAFLRRKHDRLYRQVGFGDNVRGSTNQCDGGVNKDGQILDGPVSSPYDFNITDNASVFGYPSSDTFSSCNFFYQQHNGADQEQFPKEKFFPEEGFKSSHNDSGINVDSNAHFGCNENPCSNGECFFSKEKVPQESFPSFDQAKVDIERNHLSTCFSSKDDQHSPGSCSNDLDRKSNADGKESAPGNSHADEYEAVICEEGDAPTNNSVLNDVEQNFQNQPPDDEVLCMRKSSSTSAQELPKRSPEELVNEAACIDQSCGERNTLTCEAASSVPAIDADLINGREKLKESYEYQRAIEEEWASRQWQLQLQAEESQRLRRKKRAETMRRQDMERRQKQRLEEIRETQKKDVETMNLREQLRAEIRSELSRLELTCFDMASLLRGLGILVPGQPPLLKEVHAAYKKALLKFHPDRASTKDIRQQVESEEKFKLISRMKENFHSLNALKN